MHAVDRLTLRILDAVLPTSGSSTFGHPADAHRRFEPRTVADDIRSRIAARNPAPLGHGFARATRPGDFPDDYWTRG